MTHFLTTVRASTLLAVVALMPLALSSAGCRVAKELAEDEIAEALANQMVSSYHAMSVELEVTGSGGNTVSMGISCADGGELDWSEFDSSGAICYRTVSNGCTFEVANRSFSISGEYEACGFPPTVSADGGTVTVEDLDGQSISIKGSTTVDSEEFEARTCSYELTMDSISVTANGDSVTVESSISGSICERGEVDISTEIEVSPDFNVQ